MENVTYTSKVLGGNDTNDPLVKLRREVTRLADLLQMQTALCNDQRVTNGFYRIANGLHKAVTDFDNAQKVEG